MRCDLFRDELTGERCTSCALLDRLREANRLFAEDEFGDDIDDVIEESLAAQLAWPPADAHYHFLICEMTALELLP